MTLFAELAMGIAVLAAFAAVLLGQNLTRSVVAGAIACLGLLLALVETGLGFVAYYVLSTVLLSVTTIQVFGWMLVDIERDQVPATDRGTWLARFLAFVLLGGGLLLLASALFGSDLGPHLESSRSGSGSVGGAVDLVGMGATVDLRSIGARVFGPWRDLATLCGHAIAAGLLGSLMLLRNDRGNSS